MFNLLFRFVKFLFDAAVVYAASDEGEAQLKGILDEAEADGIDIPFYNPDQPEGETGETGDVGDVGSTSSVRESRDAAYYLRHPNKAQEG